MTRVFIVDDQPAFRRQLRELLTHAGLTVIGEAGDIPEAEELLARLETDLAIVDVMLPGINGLEGAARLKARNPRLHVIVISAHRDRAEVFKRAAAEAGAEGFVSKDDLDMATVQEWLAFA